VSDRCTKYDKVGETIAQTIAGCSSPSESAYLGRDNQLAHSVQKQTDCHKSINYEGWNFNSGNYLFTTDTK